jgi:hypothetical protein
VFRDAGNALGDAVDHASNAVGNWVQGTVDGARSAVADAAERVAEAARGDQAADDQPVCGGDIQVHESSGGGV